jgi:hypothetical protein
MSTLRDFISKGPGHCGLTGINAKRWGEKYVILFDAEKADPGSIFALQDGETIEDRFDVLNGLYMARGANRGKVAFYIGTLMLAAMSCAIAKGKSEYEVPKKRLQESLKAQEPDNAEMASVMSVDQAGTMSIWD